MLLPFNISTYILERTSAKLTVTILTIAPYTPKQVSFYQIQRPKGNLTLCDFVSSHCPTVYERTLYYFFLLISSLIRLLNKIGILARPVTLIAFLTQRVLLLLH